MLPLGDGLRRFGFIVDILDIPIQICCSRHFRKMARTIDRKHRMRARLAGRDNGGGLILHSGLFLCMHVIWFRDRCLAVSTLRPKKLLRVVSQRLNSSDPDLFVRRTI